MVWCEQISTGNIYSTLVNTQRSNIKIMNIDLGILLNIKLDWTDNTMTLYRKGQSQLDLLTTLTWVLQCSMCWGGSMDRERLRLKLIKRASFVLSCLLDPTEEVGDRRMLTKLSSIMTNPCHPLHSSRGSLSSSFSTRLTSSEQEGALQQVIPAHSYQNIVWLN